MFQKIIKRLTIGITLALLLSAPIALAAGSPSQIAACKGAGGSWSGSTCKAPGPSVTTIVTRSIQLFSVIIGLVAVVMVIVAGLKYTTSNGDPNQIAGAKNTLLYAIVGIVVAALAQ